VHDNDAGAERHAKKGKRREREKQKGPALAENLLSRIALSHSLSIPSSILLSPLPIFPITFLTATRTSLPSRSFQPLLVALYSR
jgi:hypothetical protein